MSDQQRHDYLRRLPSESYRGRAIVHWSMSIDDRRTGWLNSLLHFQLREILTHTAFRYGLACPIYCCMPDHIHMLWIGIDEVCDQRNAAQFFRGQTNKKLAKFNCRLQKQPYDRVLRDNDKLESAVQDVAEYIARNPERAGLVPADKCQTYEFTGCLMPGHPELSPWQEEYWQLFWRLYDRLVQHGLMVRDVDPDSMRR